MPLLLLLLLGKFNPRGLGLAGVIIPKSPPCFAIPYFHHVWWGSQPSGQSAFIQDIADGQLSSFAKFPLDQYVKTIPASKIHSILLDSGEYSLAHSDNGEDEPPLFLNSASRLFAFAESLDRAYVGHLEPMRHRLASYTVKSGDFILGSNEKSNSESHFQSLEIGRFCQDRNLCLSSLKLCFESLSQHNRALAVHWLKMTKDSLKGEGILESSD